VRTHTVPRIKNDRLSYSALAWEMGVRCVSPPGQACFPANDGECVCRRARDEGAEDPPSPLAPGSRCRLRLATKRRASGTLVRGVACEGSCVPSAHSCQFRGGGRMLVIATIEAADVLRKEALPDLVWVECGCDPSPLSRGVPSPTHLASASEAEAPEIR
jgi:hypothetical protein